MAGVPEKVLNWLYSVLPSEYADVNRTYHDITETLSNYPSLSPRTEVYTYENGASALLLQLHGTLPVTFRGATYGFPVQIWVPHNYPRDSPIVYVVPVKDMIVRPGQHVSSDGRVYHPYLAQWAKYWDKSTLFDFLAVLRGVFAKEPPVRSQQQQSAQYQAPVPQAPPPVPPPPVEWRRSVQSVQTTSPSPRPSSGPPAPPPKPPKPYEPNGQSGGTSQPQQDRYSRPPPLPPQPHQQQQQQPRIEQPPQYQGQRSSYTAPNSWQQQGPPQRQSQQQQQQQSSYDMNQANSRRNDQGNPGYASDVRASRPPMPQVQHQGTPNYQESYQIGSPVSPITPDDQVSKYQQTVPLPQQAQNYTQPPQQYQQQQFAPAQQAYQQLPSQGYPPQQYPQYQQQQQQQHPPPPQQAPPPPQPPINLLDDSLEVTLPSQTGNQAPIPVPPVPPNPEKDALLRALSQTLCTQIRQTVTSNASAVAPLRAQQSALQNAYSRLQSELSQLEQLDASLEQNERILKDTMVEADRVMENARRRKVPEVDDVLVAPTVVGGQLWSLVCEERGIEECLFVLGAALDKGRVGGDVFVKQTRSLAREQFLKKALIKKISKGMQLDDYHMR